METRSIIGNSEVIVDRYTYGHDNISIYQWGEGASLRIGSFCSISTDIKVFLGGNHRVDWITTFPFGSVFIDDLGERPGPGHPTTNGDVIIGHDVWIAAGVTIMSGVKIGSGAILAANSHVVNDVHPYEIVGGNPAKHIRWRFHKNIIDLLLKLEWWTLPPDTIKQLSGQLSQSPTVPQLKELIEKYRYR